MTQTGRSADDPTAGRTAPPGATGPGGNRWVLVGAGLLLQFSIGAVYAW